MTIYTGYVYIWYDTKSKFYYIGSHYGKTTDSYVCSNKMMLRAYSLRPETFKFKVLQYINGSHNDILLAEQQWLNLIKNDELYWTENIYNKTVRYYNQKKIAAGGSVKGHKKNISKPSWRKGYTSSDFELRKKGLLSFIPLDKPKETKTKEIRKCLQCKTDYVVKNKTQKYCSLSCVSKSTWKSGKAKPHFKKGQEAPNKGKHNPKGAENGKKGAAKQSATVIGRKRKYLNDGNWIWQYPE